MFERAGKVGEGVLGRDHRAKAIGRADQVLQRSPMPDLNATDRELLPREVSDVPGDLVAVEDADERDPAPDRGGLDRTGEVRGPDDFEDVVSAAVTGVVVEGLGPVLTL